MDKVLKKSLELSLALFPEVYSSRKSYRTYHFGFAWAKGKRLVAISVNNPHTQSQKAKKFALKFGTRKQQVFPYLHCEIALISKLWGRVFIDGDMRIVLVRINRFGELNNTKPCESCTKVFKKLGVTKIDYTTKDGWESVN